MTIRLTGLPCIACCHFRATFLVVYKPLLETPHDLPAISKGTISPLFLRFNCKANFVLNVSLTICNKSTKVVGGSRVVASDVFSSLYREGRHKIWIEHVRFKARVLDFESLEIGTDLLGRVSKRAKQKVKNNTLLECEYERELPYCEWTDIVGTQAIYQEQRK